MFLMFGRLQALVPSEGTPPRHSEERHGEILFSFKPIKFSMLWIKPELEVKPEVGNKTIVTKHNLFATLYTLLKTCKLHNDEFSLRHPSV